MNEQAAQYYATHAPAAAPTEATTSAEATTATAAGKAAPALVAAR